jgi:hypothetical protein
VSHTGIDSGRSSDPLPFCLLERPSIEFHSLNVMGCAFEFDRSVETPSGNQIRLQKRQCGSIPVARFFFECCALGSRLARTWFLSADSACCNDKASRIEHGVNDDTYRRVTPPLHNPG